MDAFSKAIEPVRAGSAERNHAVLRATVLLFVLALGLYTAFFRLGAEGWHADEPTYRDAGLEYIQDNDFRSNLEHPFPAKYLLGVTQVVLGSSEREAVRIPAAGAFLLTGITLFLFGRRVAGLDRGAGTGPLDDLSSGSHIWTGCDTTASCDEVASGVIMGA